jgi:hypothetical protein
MSFVDAGISTLVPVEVVGAIVWSFLWTKVYWQNIYKVWAGNLRGLVYGLFLILIVLLPLFFLCEFLYTLEDIHPVSHLAHQIAFLLVMLPWGFSMLFFNFKFRKDDPARTDVPLSGAQKRKACLTGKHEDMK